MIINPILVSSIFLLKDGIMTAQVNNLIDIYI